MKSGRLYASTGKIRKIGGKEKGRAFPTGNSQVDRKYRMILM